MNQFIESLKRLYNDGKIAIFKLNKLLESKVITDEEYEYITRRK